MYQFPYQPYQPAYDVPLPYRAGQVGAATYAAQAGAIGNVRTVANEEEARRCVTPLGRTLLMDANEARFYVRDLGPDGTATVKAYEFREVEDNPAAPADGGFEEWRKQYEPGIRRIAELFPSDAAAAAGANAAADAVGARADAALNVASAGGGAGAAHLR